jgi:hypothetical protein
MDGTILMLCVRVPLSISGKRNGNHVRRAAKRGNAPAVLAIEPDAPVQPGGLFRYGIMIFWKMRVSEPARIVCARINPLS